MTLSPLDNRRVRGVSADRYVLNDRCSHPECSEPADDGHHCFRRSAIGNDSWFVEVEEDDGQITLPLPHVTGLCRAHHDLVTRNKAWIRLEQKEFVWYDKLWRMPRTVASMSDGQEAWWVALGALNPQPGSREAKPKRKRKQGEERRKRRTISIRVPDDAEDGAAVYDETLALVKERLVAMELYSEGDKIAAYEATIAAWTDWLNG